MPTLISVDFQAGGGCASILGEERSVHILHLIVAEDKGLEGVDIGDLLEALAVILYKINNYRFYILTFYKFEKL